jgi:hypothetical protein
MQQFAVVVKEIRTFLTSFKIVNLALPFHLHLLFGGLGLLLVEELLLKITSYSSSDTLYTLFYDIPIHLIAYYGFFVGLWLTLISKDVKYLPYGLWGYAFLALFPFENLGLDDIVKAVIYGVAGYAAFLYTATSVSEADTSTLSV